jgi:tetratricopeptide (TPR) repeat protein/DNA repair exonuclease SbcCD nuclease subunit
VTSPVNDVRSIRILHVSDLHIFTNRTIAGRKGVKGDPTLTEAALEDMENQLDSFLDSLKTTLSRLPEFRSADIVVTGDIAFSGSPDEYSRAGRFLNEVKSIVGTTDKPARVFLCPGNHDLKRNTRGIQKTWMEHISMGSRERTQDLYEECKDPVVVEGFKKSQRHFYDFARSQGAGVPRKGQLFSHDFEELQNPSLTINLVGLNSSWLYGGPLEYFGFVGVQQAERAFDAVRAATRERVGRKKSIEPPRIGTVNIVFLHHPSEAQAEPDQQEVQQLILDKSDLVLTGHVHQHRVFRDVSSKPDGSKHPIVSSARCVFDEHIPHTPGLVPGYSLIEVDIDHQGLRGARLWQVKYSTTDEDWSQPHAPIEVPLREERAASSIRPHGFHAVSGEITGQSAKDVLQMLGAHGAPFRDALQSYVDEVVDTQNKFQTAATVVDRVLEVAAADLAQDDASLYSISHTYICAGRDEDALRILSRAEQQRGSLPDPLRINKARALVGLGRAQEALPIYDSMLADAPNDSTVRLHRATALEHMRRFDEAAADFETAIREIPKDAASLVGLAECSLGLGQIDEARQTFMRAREFAPGRINLERLEVVLYLFEDRFDLARRFFHESAERFGRAEWIPLMTEELHKAPYLTRSVRSELEQLVSGELRPGQVREPGAS